jgi:3-deoxy-D-manno-octulosonic acid kinase
VSGRVPAGYTSLELPGASAVCRAEARDAVRAALAAHPTLYAYAESHPARRAFHGRAPTYAVPLPGGVGDVVVRHAWHGGALRRVTRDLFAPPTRAPGELRTSERLRAAGVRTPAVVAYARYPAPLGLRRVDVATRLVPGARDLADVLLPNGAAGADAGPAAGLRAGWLDATAALLADLARAGARHPDLNLKNVLLARDPDPAGGGIVRAWVLDVDVAALPARPATGNEVRAAFDANLARLGRSVAKWRRGRGLTVGDADIAALRDRALAHLSGGAAPA